MKQLGYICVGVASLNQVTALLAHIFRNPWSGHDCLLVCSEGKKHNFAVEGRAPCKKLLAKLHMCEIMLGDTFVLAQQLIHYTMSTTMLKIQAGLAHRGEQKRFSVREGHTYPADPGSAD